MTDAPKNVYTEEQHFALLESAVERETASIVADKGELEVQVASLSEAKAGVEAQLAEAQGRIDVLEAEKANAEAATKAAVDEFDAYKAELARVAEVEAAKAERVARVKAANSNLADEYFTAERAQRWAEMSGEAFDALVADMTDSFAAVKAPAVEAAAEVETPVVETETAAFSGGETATVSEGSTFATFLAARRGRI